MTLEQIIILALVQGITEFLPISSSAHLILVPVVFGWQDQGILIDVAAHVGTLLAVLIYFRHEVGQLITGALALLGGRVTAQGRLALSLVIATIPVVIAGYLLTSLDLVQSLRGAVVIGWTTIVFGIVLFLADQLAPNQRRLEHMTYGAAIAIGLAQVLSLVPGTSRSGITMTAARALGFERREAARYSMLMSIPTIIAAGLLAGLELKQTGDAQLTMDAVVAGLFAFGSAMAAIWGLLKLLERLSFTPFVIYRIALGAGLLYWVYS